MFSEFCSLRFYLLDLIGYLCSPSGVNFNHKSLPGFHLSSKVCVSLNPNLIEHGVSDGINSAGICLVQSHLFLQEFLVFHGHSFALFLSLHLGENIISFSIQRIRKEHFILLSCLRECFLSFLQPE